MRDSLSNWFKKRYNISVFTQHRVVGVYPEDKSLSVMDLVSGEIKRNYYDQLVFATGSIPLSPPPFDRQSYTNVFHVKTIQNNRDIKALIEEKHPQKIVIVGAGFIGLEKAEQLIHQDIDVTLIEFQNQILPSMDKDMAFRLEEHLQKGNI